MDTTIKKSKVALITVCTGYRYWPYIGPMFKSAREFFLKEHDVDFLLWTDIPGADEKDGTNYGSTAFHTEHAGWPYPTLMRYNLFLQQEEKLREYDYIFYCDADMLFVDTVGSEILGDGLTATDHPSRTFRKEYSYPFEPNINSTAYVKIPHHYFAGGFQGGKSDDFITAMKVMKRGINDDFMNNYTAIWNDESHWNKYLFYNPPSVILDVSYCYPDSAIEYHQRIWGRSYKPKLVTLTKSFTTSKEAGADIKKLTQEI